MSMRREAIWLRRAVLAFGLIVVLPALGSLISRLDAHSLLILGVSLAYILLVSNVANPPAQGGVNTEAITAKLDAVRDELKDDIKVVAQERATAVETRIIEYVAHEPTNTAKDWRSEKPSPKLQAAIDYLKRNPTDAQLSTRILADRLSVSRQTVSTAKQLLGL